MPRGTPSTCSIRVAPVCLATSVWFGYGGLLARTHWGAGFSPRVSAPIIAWGGADHQEEREL